MTLPVLPALMKHVTIKFAAVYSKGDMEETIRLFAEGESDSGSKKTLWEDELKCFFRRTTSRVRKNGDQSYHD